MKMSKRMIGLCMVLIPSILMAVIGVTELTSDGGSPCPRWCIQTEHMYGPGDTVKTIPAPDDEIMGIEWVNDTLYALRQAPSELDQATLFKLDPADGSVLDQFFLPFNGYVMGLTFDGSDLWIVEWSPGTNIYNVTTSGGLITSFPAPSANPRGIVWDGQNLWIGEANNQVLYEVNTVGSVISSISIMGIIGWAMGMEWVPEHTNGHLWVNDDDYVSTYDDINQLNLSGGVAYLIQEFLHPAQGNIIPEGICHDGEHLWISEYYSTVLWQIDDGIIESIEENHASSPQVAISLSNSPNPFCRSTMIQYTLSQTNHIEVVVFDHQGQRIRTLVQKIESPGKHAVLWNRFDESGNSVPNGVYFCILMTSSGEMVTQKLIVLD